MLAVRTSCGEEGVWIGLRLSKEAATTMADLFLLTPSPYDALCELWVHFQRILSLSRNRHLKVLAGCHLLCYFGTSTAHNHSPGKLLCDLPRKLEYINR